MASIIARGILGVLTEEHRLALRTRRGNCTGAAKFPANFLGPLLSAGSECQRAVDSEYERV